MLAIKPQRLVAAFRNLNLAIKLRPFTQIFSHITVINVKLLILIASVNPINRVSSVLKKKFFALFHGDSGSKSPTSLGYGWFYNLCCFPVGVHNSAAWRLV